MSINNLLGKIFYSGLKYRTKTIKCKGRSFNVEVADSFRKLSVGLMNHEKLEKNGGMLFIFGSDEGHGFWMMNMKFSIDIIWLDRNQKVVYIINEAQPCTSMLGCETYTSDKLSRYVVELRAGTAKEMKLKVGDQFEF